MKLRKSFYRLRAMVLMALTILSLDSPARAQDWSRATVAPPVEVETAMRTLLEQMPLMRGAVVKGYVPVYAPLSKRIVYYEAKLDGLQREGNGYVVLNTAGRVVEFTTSGPSTYERLSEQTREPFRMVRLGSAYAAAENEDGRIVAEVGQFPLLNVDDSTGQLVTSPNVYFTNLE